LTNRPTFDSLNPTDPEQAGNFEFGILNLKFYMPSTHPLGEFYAS
jgi:hypothetical protein